MKNIKLLIEEILDSTGKPYAAVVDSEKVKPDSESSFCLHQPAIKKFALTDPDSMAILISFVFFTMQKEWFEVAYAWDEFMRWVLVNHKKQLKNPSMEWVDYDDDALWKPMSNSIGPKGRFLKTVWKNKYQIYDDIMQIINKNPTNTQEEMLDVSVKVWYRLLRVDGLGPVKAAFTVQLMLGQLGCIDSINSIVYEPLASADLFTRGKTKAGDLTLKISAPKKDGELDAKGRKVAAGYIEFLKALQQVMKGPISKVLWDVWCDIVAEKIKHSGAHSERSPIGITLPDGKIQSVNPYAISSKNERSIGQYKERNPNVTGYDIGRQHSSLVKDVRNRIGESFKDFVNEACWKNYKQEGMKKKGKRMVPNCVPKKKKKK